MKIDKATADKLARELSDLLKSHFSKYPDLTVTYKGGSYDADGFTFKPRIEFKATDGENTRERADFLKYADLFGLKAEDYGREFESHGMKFRLSGLNPSRPKFSVEAVNVADGRVFKFTARILVAKFNATVEPFLLAGVK